MTSVDVILGLSLMLTGTALIFVAIFRALGHRWSLGLYEMWALPAAGIGLVLLGRWAIA